MKAWFAARFVRVTQAVFVRLQEVRIPTPAVLPAAGAVVGLYSGLAAGIFANLVALVSGLAFALPRVWTQGLPDADTLAEVSGAFVRARWHLEYLFVGGPLAAAALAASRWMDAAGELTRRRLRVLALLTLGALGLYYPLVALSALNVVFGQMHALNHAIERLPIAAVVVIPALGGWVVGRMLEKHPENHGHGLPEVHAAVQSQGGGLNAAGGVRKLVASAVTIGSGGSAGREGPIVYTGAAFATAVGRTLGFSRRELSVLLAAGAGAGIAASFNAPIAGSIFALEIILRAFEPRVFSPIVLASVTATMVGRGLLGEAPMLERFSYEMVSGWEIFAYVGLGLVLGALSFVFTLFLQVSERFFRGEVPHRRWVQLARQSLALRAMLGGLAVGLMGAINPTVWGSGHAFVNLATAGQLTFQFMMLACGLKMVATAVTLGSGGSGGTFFPGMVMGAMAGGAFGDMVHVLLPSVTAPSGAYALVGVGGAIAGMTRAPLTGLMMLYELSANSAIILPLMVTCTISTALCHWLLERTRLAPVIDTERFTLESSPPTPAAGYPVQGTHRQAKAE